MKKTLILTKETIDMYHALMQAKHVDYEKEKIAKYETVVAWGVAFDEGYDVDIKVCASNNGDPLWCEAVLFLNGSEVSCTDVADELVGTWELFDGEKVFQVDVKVEEVK